MQTEAIANHISNWIKEYLDDCPAKGLVIGISGGIDSAVTSTLGALTGYPVICLEMPIHQEIKQDLRGQEHIAQLSKRFENVSSMRIDLTTVYDAFVKVQPTLITERTDLALANTRSRLRMTTMYQIATSMGYLVLGTGNKVEDFGVGFYTKYGDGGVDISPIADLLKTEVFALGSFLKVPQSILDAPPTDGLWGDDRTDEDQIGATYPELEWAMAQVAAGNTPDDFVDRNKEVMEIYLRFNRANQHKMRSIPVCTIPDTLRSAS
ncbi:MAG: NAD(+) synthase [Schleiferiaceae bacterium]|nr:NAD(+) synthase [Schleiferiaceae bacterium]